MVLSEKYINPIYGVTHEEVDAIIYYVQNKGGFLIIVDDSEWDSSGLRNEKGDIYASNAFSNLTGHTNFKWCVVSPGKVYFNATSYDTDDDPIFVSYPDPTAEDAKIEIDSLLKHEANFYPHISTNAPPSVIVQSRMVNDRLYIYVANFTGTTHVRRMLCKGNQIPTVQTNLTFTFTSSKALNVQCLPYLGDLRPLNTEFDGSKVTIYLDTLIVGATIITDYELGISENVSSGVVDCKLIQNYPNPFTHSTSIIYQIGNTKYKMLNAKYSLTIYDLAGRLVRTLVNEPIPNSQSPVPNSQFPLNQVIWDGKNESGQEVKSGVYFCQLQAKNYVSTKKMILIR